MIEQSLSKVAKYIKDAVKLSLWMEPWLYDQENIKEKKHVFFAIDSNIVALFTNAQRQLKQTPRFARIFHDDSDHISASIARLLTYYLFWVLGKKQKHLIMFPSGAEDVKRMYHMVALKAEEHFNKFFSTNKLERLREKLLKHYTLPDDDDRINRIYKDAVELLEIIYEVGDSPVVELSRFANLLKSKIVATPQFLSINKDLYSNTSLDNFIVEYENISNDQLAIYRERWFVNLCSLSSKKSKLRIYEDANTLAQLECLNRSLKEKNAYVILITADRSICNASIKYKPQFLDESFGHAYIRHPKAFLANPEIVAIKNNNTQSTNYYDSDEENINLYEWTKVFLEILGDSKSILKISDRELKNIASNMLSNDPQVFKDFREKWDKIVNLLTFNGWLNEDQTELKLFAKRLIKGKKDIVGIVQNKISDLWEDIFKIAVDGGHSLFFAPSRDDLPPRSVPVLRFEKFPKTRNYFLNILKQKNNRKTLSKKEKNLLNALKKEDPSNYSYYLSVGLFFFSAQRWRITHILAKRALRISSLYFGDNKITGHEASYLLSITSRVNAKSISDLEPVKHYLYGAIKKIRKLKNNNKYNDIRYDSEWQALWLTYHLFGIFTKETTPKNIQDLNTCRMELAGLISRIGSEKNLFVRLKTGRQLLTNYFLCNIILKYNEDTDIKDEQQTNDFLKKFINSIQSEESKSIIPEEMISFRVRSIYFLSRIIYGDKKEKKALISDALDLLSDNNIEKHKTMPYDEGRYNFFREVIIREYESFVKSNNKR